MLPYPKVWAHFFHVALLGDALVSFRSPEINLPSIKASRIEEILESAFTSSFEVMGEGFSFDYGQNGGLDFDRIMIESNSYILSPEISDELIKELSLIHI